MGEPVLTITAGTDGTHLDIFGTHPGAGQQEGVGSAQGEPKSLAAPVNGRRGIAIHLLMPGICDVISDDIAA
jgi:hypothetical protein